MVEEKNEKISKEKKIAKSANASLGKLMLDTSVNRYHLISLALRWTRELQKTPEGNKPVSELLNRALLDLLTGKVKPGEIEKLSPWGGKEGVVRKEKTGKDEK